VIVEQSSSIARLEALPMWDGKQKFEIDLPRRILAALDNPQDKVPAIHITGTNGKGSVSAMIAAMLWCAGKKVGQFASPHLSHLTERCLIDGMPAQLESFNSAVEKVFAAVEAENASPSFFEVITAASFLEFVRTNCDWAVIEVGLGGRLDATNTIKQSRVTVVTGIDFDHMNVLGNSLADIAKEKAGIFRSGVPAFVGKVAKEAENVLRAEAKRVGAPIEFLGQDFSFDHQSNTLRCKERTFELNPSRYALQGLYERENAILAARVAAYLEISSETIQQGLEVVRWPGRCEMCELRADNLSSESKRVLFDVAHNPAGMSALCDCLQELKADIDKFVFVISIINRKDWRGMLGELKRFVSSLDTSTQTSFIFTDCPGHEIANLSQAVDLLGAGIIILDPQQALSSALESASANSLIVITGSVFHVGNLRPFVVKEPYRSIAGV